jgi:FdrA protein
MVGKQQKQTGTVLPDEIKAINIGISAFAQALNQQCAPVIHVDWKPPAGGEPRLVELLKRIKK